MLSAARCVESRQKEALAFIKIQAQGDRKKIDSISTLHGVRRTPRQRHGGIQHPMLMGNPSTATIDTQNDNVIICTVDRAGSSSFLEMKNDNVV
ncbi:MAG: hypothetical protein ACKVOT_15410 [Polaromonas sp.]